MKRKTIVGLIAIAAVIVVAMLAGCIAEHAPTSVIETPVPTELETSVLTDQDSEYIAWVAVTGYSIKSDLDLITSACDRSDYNDVELYSEMLNEDVTEALVEIRQFDDVISPWLKPSKIEFKLALRDLQQGAYYCKQGAKSHDNADFVTCGDYLKSAGTHIKRTAVLAGYRE